MNRLLRPFPLHPLGIVELPDCPGQKIRQEQFHFPRELRRVEQLGEGDAGCTREEILRKAAGTMEDEVVVQDGKLQLRALTFGNGLTESFLGDGLPRTSTDVANLLAVYASVPGKGKIEPSALYAASSAAARMRLTSFARRRFVRLAIECHRSRDGEDDRERIA